MDRQTAAALDRWLTTDPANEPERYSEEPSPPFDEDAYAAWIESQRARPTDIVTLSEIDPDGVEAELMNFDNERCGCCGSGIGPGLREDADGYERGSWGTCFAFASVVNARYRICEDCAVALSDGRLMVAVTREGSKLIYSEDAPAAFLYLITLRESGKA